MKNLKKVLILLLVVVLAAGVLTACAGKAEKSGEGKKFVIATDKGFSPFEFEDEGTRVIHYTPEIYEI